ncbi:MAG: hypothetical protein K0S70_65 [Microbacterium sp.]|jgi:hypothetical protein|nr:hypothetical protein [Microbacterium sp.]
MTFYCPGCRRALGNLEPCPNCEPQIKAPDDSRRPPGDLVLTVVALLSLAAWFAVIAASLFEGLP